MFEVRLTVHDNHNSNLPHLTTPNAVASYKISLDNLLHVKIDYCYMSVGRANAFLPQKYSHTRLVIHYFLVSHYYYYLIITNLKKELLSASAVWCPINITDEQQPLESHSNEATDMHIIIAWNTSNILTSNKIYANNVKHKTVQKKQISQ